MNVMAVPQRFPSHLEVSKGHTLPLVPQVPAGALSSDARNDRLLNGGQPLLVDRDGSAPVFPPVSRALESITRASIEASVLLG